MKTIFSFLVILSLMISPVFANDVRINDHAINGLSESQVAKLYADAAQMSEANASAADAVKNIPTAQKLDEYAALAKSISTGLADTAKNLGIAVNDFANSPVGKITEFVIIYKVIGNIFVHYLLGALWFLIVGLIWWTIFRKTCLGHYDFEYDKTTGKRIAKTWVDADDGKGSATGMRWAMALFAAVISLIGCIITFTG